MRTEMEAFFFINRIVRLFVVSLMLVLTGTATVCIAAEETDRVCIKVVGDIVLPEYIPDPSVVFKGVQEALKADILIGNLEGPITSHPHSPKNTKRRYTFAFKFPPMVAPRLLRETGFTILHVANNHSNDYGEIGFSETLQHLSDVGLKYTGLKGQILYHEYGAATIAVIGFGYAETQNSVNIIHEAVALVKEARRYTDFVIVTMHAGAEGERALYVRNRQEIFLGENRGNLVRFSHAIIDAGALAVIGFGPHVVRGIEYYKGRLIAYSLGNFVPAGDLSTSGTMRYSAIIELVFALKDPSLMQASIIPVVFINGYPQVDEAKGTIYLIRRLTAALYKAVGRSKQNVFIGDDGQIQFRNE